MPKEDVQPAGAIEQLASVFATYSQATDRMRQVYQQLQSDVLRLREELAVKNEQLERKSRLAALGEMAAGMAHEIRNPLGGMQLYASLLKRDLAGQDIQFGWAKKISNCIITLDQIVNDMLTFTTDQICEKQPVPLIEIVDEVVGYVQPQIETTGVKIDTTEIDDKLLVQADINMLRRILLNIVLNAVDAATERGPVSIGAEKCLKNPDYDARIWVKDNGGGIKPELMSRIFNPFFTTKDTGTGLGLAIVHRLVECHGGFISASNNTNGGATFTILLPS